MKTLINTFQQKTIRHKSNAQYLLYLVIKLRQLALPIVTCRLVLQHPCAVVNARRQATAEEVVTREVTALHILKKPTTLIQDQTLP